MRIEADGCVLRPWSDVDVPAIVAACRDPEIVRWLPMIPQPYTVGDARTFVAHALHATRAGDEAQFAIVDEHETLLGSVGLRLRLTPHEELPSIGYWVAPEVRGRGIATAATNALAAWAFETLGIARLALYAEPGNVASQRVAVRCGFARVPREARGEGGRELWVFEREAQ